MDIEMPGQNGFETSKTVFIIIYHRLNLFLIFNQ
jgi:hypothetical protein